MTDRMTSSGAALRQSLRAAAMAATLALGCDEIGGEVREWTPADHLQPRSAPAQPVTAAEQGSATEQGAAPEQGAAAESAPQAPPLPFDEVTAATWRRTCAGCHGPMGLGDGPSAMGTKPRNLTDSRWQATLSDEELAASIRGGKGAMPAFALPPRAIAGLVALVRFLDPTRRVPPPVASPPSDAAASTGAPTTSTAPAAPTPRRATPAASAEARQPSQSAAPSAGVRAIP